MKNKAHRSVLLANLLLALGVALFISIYRLSADFTILDHSFRLNIEFLVVWVACFVLLLLASSLLARREAGLFDALPESGRRRGVPALLPLGFFLLSPWLLHFYTSRDDLRVRLRLLALFIIAAVLFLSHSRFARFLPQKGSGLDKAVAKFSTLSLRRRLVFLFLASFLVYQAAALVLVFQGASFSGDEPYYLLSSHSLLKDGDINVADNYARQDYFHFYSKKDNPRLKLGVYGRKGKEYIYPINLPGISVLMLPFYWLSQVL